MVITMPEAHKRAHRHPKYKTSYRVSNWPEYDKALRDRGDITLWITQKAIKAWTPPKSGKRGGQPVYSDIAIETALTLRLLFHLPLRQTEGFLHSILKLMELAPPSPDHTTLSRQNATVKISRLENRGSPGPIELIVDSTELKVCGQGEWHDKKHGENDRKTWKKRHIGVDVQGWIIASRMTESNEQDPPQVPDLLDQIDGNIERFIADGIYDQEPVYTAVTDHSPDVQVIIPPRKDTVLNPESATSPPQRDQLLLDIQQTDRFEWKRTSVYDDQAYGENAFSRYKRIFGGGFRAKRDDAQEREAQLSCVLCNRLRELGRPQSYPVN